MSDLLEALWQFGNDGLNGERPFRGQPHTFEGRRGATELAHLRVRDVHDCIALALLRLYGRSDAFIDGGGATWNDVDDAAGEAARPFESMDMMAFAQAVCCELERRMGIYPNVSPLLPAPPESTKGDQT
jgi:hypothetical protein